VAWNLGLLGASSSVAGSFDLLETTLISTNTASVTFSGLGSYSDYKHLQIRFVARGNDTNLYMSFNTDNNNDNYRGHTLNGDGATVYSQTSTLGIQASQVISTEADVFTAGVIDILDFAASKTGTVRTLTGVAGSSTKRISLTSGMRDSTAAAITAIRLDMAYGGSGLWQIGSRFSLYGIR
jgi:hypothetical protein